MDLGNAAVLGKLNEIENARRRDSLRQLDPRLALWDNHAVSSHLFERLFAQLVGCLADDLRHTKILQIQGCDDTGRQIRADGDHRAVAASRAE